MSNCIWKDRLRLLGNLLEDLPIRRKVVTVVYDDLLASDRRT